VGSETEVLDSLTGVLGATEEDDVGTGWGAESELVECDSLTTGLLNASTSSGGELQRADAELGKLEETVVIGDGTNDGTDLALVDLGSVLVGGDGDDLGEGHWWGVDARHTQSPQDGGIELALRATVQEFVQLVQNLAVRVGAGRRLTHALDSQVQLVRGLC